MGAAEQVKSAATTDAVDQLLADAPDAIVILDAHGEWFALTHGLKSCSGTPKRSCWSRSLICLCLGRV